jgi:hypothetical protein
MIEIGRLRLQLPAGFEQRGEPIARLIGDALSQQQVVENRRLEQLSIGPLHIDPSQSNAKVAQVIANAIGRQLGPRGE